MAALGYVLRLAGFFLCGCEFLAARAARNRARRNLELVEGTWPR